MQDAQDGRNGNGTRPGIGPAAVPHASAARDARALVTLANWREPPQARWAFQHVREILPTAEIAARAPAPLVADAPHPVAELEVMRLGGSEAGGTIPFGDLLAETGTSGLLVLRHGHPVAQWRAPWFEPTLPHVVFSVTKSVTGLLAGILAGRGLLDPDAALTDYVPEAEGGAYGDATVRNLLDMTVSADFEESYADTTGGFARYRIASGWNPSPSAEPPDLRGFLATLPPGSEPHGTAFRYLSPNSDMLGWVLERASGRRYGELASELLWTPMHAAGPAHVTVDGRGLARAAGGLSTTLADLARLGELVRTGGGGVIPRDWIADMFAGGDRGVWDRGDFPQLFPGGSYRSQWYWSGLRSGAISAIGIHGQWLWVDPTAGVVIARVAAQPVPVSDTIDAAMIAAFDRVSTALA